MLELIKEKVVVEDLEVGLGTVDQVRYDATGALVTNTFNKISADTLPYDATDTIKQAIDKKAAHGVTQAALDAKADKVDVLLKNSNTVFIPTKDYHPSTKKYVDDKVTSIGAGDMAKSVYDQDNSGVVDDSEKLAGTTADLVSMSRPSVANEAALDTFLKVGFAKVGANEFVSVEGIIDASNLMFRQTLMDSAGHTARARIGMKQGNQAIVWEPWKLPPGALPPVAGTDEGRALVAHVAGNQWERLVGLPIETGNEFKTVTTNGVDGDSYWAPFVSSPDVIVANFSLQVGQNASIVSPTINDGVTIEIPVGSSLVIL